MMICDCNESSEDCPEEYDICPLDFENDVDGVPLSYMSI